MDPGRFRIVSHPRVDPRAVKARRTPQTADSPFHDSGDRSGCMGRDGDFDPDAVQELKATATSMTAPRTPFSEVPTPSAMRLVGAAALEPVQG